MQRHYIVSSVLCLENKIPKGLVPCLENEDWNHGCDRDEEGIWNLDVS